MRTTLTLDDDVADALRERARQLSQSFKQVVNDTLRQGLSPSAGSQRRTDYRVNPHRSGLRSGVDPLKLNQLNDALEATSLDLPADE